MSYLDLEADLRKTIASEPGTGMPLDIGAQAQAAVAADTNPVTGDLLASISGQMVDAKDTDGPRRLMLRWPFILEILPVIDGFYTGAVRNGDSNAPDFEDVVLHLPQMTLEEMVQVIKTKGYAPAIPMPEMPAPEQTDNATLLSMLAALKDFQGDVHIHLEKSLLEDLQKGRPALAVGTRKTWKGREYEKHTDGTWVPVGKDGKASEKPKEVEGSLDKPAEEPAKFRMSDMDADKIYRKMSTQMRGDVLNAIYDKVKGKKATASTSALYRGIIEHIKDNPEKFMSTDPEAGLKPSDTTLDEDLKTFGLDDESKAKAEEEKKKAAEKERADKEKADQAKVSDKIEADNTPEKPKKTTLEKKRELAETAHTMTSKDYVEAAYRIAIEDYTGKEVESTKGYRLGTATKQRFKDDHKALIKRAMDEGTEIPAKVAKEYPDLQGLPEDLNDENQQKTNLFKSVDLKKVPKKRQAEVKQMLRDTNAVVESMGIKFKQPLDFRAGSSLTEGDARSTKAVYIGGGGDKRIVELKSANQAETSVMHEIGHALDYAMADSWDGSKTRSDQFTDHPSRQNYREELEKENPELFSNYQELLKTIKNSGFYKYYDQPGHAKHRAYLNNPTEIFARAFEVYSLGKAQKLVAEGKIQKSFIDDYLPDVFRNPGMGTASTSPKEFQAAYTAYNDRLIAIDAEVKAEMPDASLPTRMQESRKRQEADAEANKHKAEMERIRKEKPATPVIPEAEQKEYIAKVTELMDYILKHDEVRKALILADLLADLQKA